jgi:hypothetical protein
VEAVVEPFLVRTGLLARTPRGRIATALAWTHLAITPPKTLVPDAMLPHTPDAEQEAAAQRVDDLLAWRLQR